MIESHKQNEMTIFKLAIQLEELMKSNNDPIIQKIRNEVIEIQNRLIEKKFRVAVVGEFNRGKSSLINVLLGKRILPEDVIATTATINRITYGKDPKAYLIMKNTNQKTEEISVDDLAEYVTKLTDSSALKAYEISEAVVEYPTMLCLNDIDLIDTPGMNDEENMNAVTINRLESIDLAIVAVSALLPFSITERDFVINLLESSSICQIIFVITHIDGLRAKDRNRMISYMKDRICNDVLDGLQKSKSKDDVIYQKYESIFNNIKLYPVSSWEGMDALETGNMELYEKSGYLQLSKDLPEIILNGRSVQMIRQIALSLEKCINEYLNLLKSKQSFRDVINSILNSNDFKKKVDEASMLLEERKLLENSSDVDSYYKVNQIYNDMLKEEKVIARNLLLSLETVNESNIDVIRQAMLPCMKTEIARITSKYKEYQTEIEKEININIKSELLKQTANIEQQLLDNSTLYSKELSILKDFNNKLKMFNFIDNIQEIEEVQFHWEDSPLNIALNTPIGQSVLPGFCSLASASLVQANEQLYQIIKNIFASIASLALKLYEKLIEDLLFCIQNDDRIENQNKLILSQLNQMIEQCRFIYEEYDGSLSSIEDNNDEMQ